MSFTSPSPSKNSLNQPCNVFGGRKSWILILYLAADGTAKSSRPWGENVESRTHNLRCQATEVPWPCATHVSLLWLSRAVGCALRITAIATELRLPLSSFPLSSLSRGRQNFAPEYRGTIFAKPLKQTSKILIQGMMWRMHYTDALGTYFKVLT